MGTEPTGLKRAEAALAAFVDARQAAQVALEQCEALAESNDDLRASARKAAEAIQRCEGLLEAIAKIGPGLQEAVDSLTEGVTDASLALSGVATRTQELDDRLAKVLEGSVAGEHVSTTLPTQAEATAAFEVAVNGLKAELSDKIDELRSAQDDLHSALEQAVATVEERNTLPAPIRVRTGGWGFVLAFLSALLTGSGLWALLSRVDEPFTFETPGDRLLASGSAAVLGGLGLLACGLLLVALLRQESRWWLSVAGLLLASAATATAAIAGVRIMFA